jgi:preprotein translocase SecE subunit
MNESQASVRMASPFVRLGTFLNSVREELKQVSWPSKDELVGSVLVVFVGVALLASFISLCDFILSKAAQLLLR